MLGYNGLKYTINIKEKEIAIHPWTEEPGGIQFMGSESQT